MDAMQTCTITRAENNAAARTERRDTLHDLAYGTLIVRFMAATLAPLCKIPTPAFVDAATPIAKIKERAETPLIDVLSDQLAGRDSDVLWAELVTILANSPAGLQWLRERAKEYAAFHVEAEAQGEWA